MINQAATRANYDRMSRWYDWLSGGSERPARLRGLQMLAVQPSEQVLELGCGTGEVLAMLAASVGPGGSVHGLDLSRGMLEVARAKTARAPSPQLVLLQGDAVDLPFANDWLDAIFMSFTLELFTASDMSRVLQECYRVLQPGGRMGIAALLQSESPGWMERLYNWAHRQWPLMIDCRPIPVEDMVRSAGFSISRVVEMSMWGLAVGILLALKNQAP